jgi:hypothetical protein
MNTAESIRTANARYRLREMLARCDAFADAAITLGYSDEPRAARIMNGFLMAEWGLAVFYRREFEDSTAIDNGLKSGRVYVPESVSF